MTYCIRGELNAVTRRFLSCTVSNTDAWKLAARETAQARCPNRLWSLDGAVLREFEELRA